jgi:hypothetical protein
MATYHGLRLSRAGLDSSHASETGARHANEARTPPRPAHSRSAPALTDPRRSGCRSVVDPPPATVGSRPGDALTLITLLVALVVALALVYNRRVWRPRSAAARMPGDGLSVGELMAPLASLAVILLVFVLVQTYASWAAAGTAATDEATAPLLLFRETYFVADARFRSRLHKQVVCYASSVIHQDWPAMGDRRVSSVPTYWAALIREAGVRLVRARGGSTAGEHLVQRDGERATARQDRLGEARPTVPTVLSGLMLGGVAVVLAVIGTVPRAAVEPRAHLAIVVASAVVFAATLILIRDLDQPYSGALHRNPTETEFVRAQIAAEVRGPLPCDDAGMPTRVPGFRATTAPLG